MPSAIQCPECGRSFSTGDENLGKRGRCKGCGTIFTMSSAIGPHQAAAEAGGDRPLSRFPGTDSNTPTRLDRFVIRTRLGAGAFGMVYRAYDPQLDREVALKVPRAEALDTPQAQERFFREAKAAAQLRHPHIVPVFDAGRDGEYSYIASAFIEGQTLADAVADGPLHRDEAARIVAALGDALAYAHSLGIIHRDVKPSNVMLDDSGQPHLMDFGLARLEGSAEKLTHDGAVLGTPAYMSPEQAAGKDSTAASDQYSLGVLFYELLCGETPFQGPPPVVIHNVLSQEAARPRSINPTVSADLETICLKAMAKVPGDRYDGCQNLASDLQRWLDDEPIQARRHGLVERAQRWTRRNPAVAALTTAVGLLLMVVALVAIIQESRTSAALKQVQIQRRAAEAAALRISKEQEQTKLALVEARTERARAEELRLQAQMRLAHSDRERGQTLCEQGYLHQGLHWFVRGLEDAPSGAKELRNVLYCDLGDWSGQFHRPLGFLPASGLFDADFSPDGQRILTGGKTAQLWDAASGAPIGAPLQKEEFVVGVAFSPDGKTAVTGSQRGTARMWNVATGNQIGPTLQHQGRVEAVAFSPDGKTIVTGASTAQIWDRETGQHLWSSVTVSGQVQGVAFSSDSKTILLGDNRGIWDWNAATGMTTTQRLDLDGIVTDVAFSPDGRTVLTGGSDETARLWVAATGKQIGPPLKHQGQIADVAFSPDGKTVLTGSFDQTARLWDAATGAPIGASLQHDGEVRAVAFSPDGKTILTVSRDGVHLWETSVVRPAGASFEYHGEVASVAFSPNGTTVLTGSRDGTAQRWDAATGKAIGTPWRHDKWITVVAISPNGRTAVTAGGQIARLWDMTTGSPADVSPKHPGSIEAVAFSADGRILLTRSDLTVCLWEVATGIPIGKGLQHDGIVSAVAFSPDGKTVLTFGGSTGCRWEAATGKPIDILPRSKGQVRSFAFSPDGKTILAVDGGKARFWDAITGSAIRTPFQQQELLEAVAYSPDGRLILARTSDGAAVLWEAATGKLIGKLVQYQGVFYTIVFSPDSKSVLTMGSDKTARLWDASTAMPIGAPIRHQGRITAVALSPEGRTLISCGDDRTARLWNVPTRIDGDVNRLVRCVEVLTKMKLDPDGVSQPMPGSWWKERLQDLEKLGGSPIDRTR